MAFTRCGVTVDVAHNIRGLIPRLHLAENASETSGEEIFARQKLKCKVNLTD
jgi:hypothetical protein